MSAQRQIDRKGATGGLPGSLNNVRNQQVKSLQSGKWELSPGSCSDEGARRNRSKHSQRDSSGYREKPCSAGKGPWDPPICPLFPTIWQELAEPKLQPHLPLNSQELRPQDRHKWTPRGQRLPPAKPLALPLQVRAAGVALRGPRMAPGRAPWPRLAQRPCTTGSAISRYAAQHCERGPNFRPCLPGATCRGHMAAPQTALQIQAVPRPPRSVSSGASRTSPGCAYDSIALLPLAALAHAVPWNPLGFVG